MCAPKKQVTGIPPFLTNWANCRQCGGFTLQESATYLRENSLGIQVSWSPALQSITQTGGPKDHPEHYPNVVPDEEEEALTPLWAGDPRDAPEPDAESGVESPTQHLYEHHVPDDEVAFPDPDPGKINNVAVSEPDADVEVTEVPDLSLVSKTVITETDTT